MYNRMKAVLKTFHDRQAPISLGLAGAAEAAENLRRKKQRERIEAIMQAEYDKRKAAEKKKEWDDTPKIHIDGAFPPTDLYDVLVTRKGKGRWTDPVAVLRAEREAQRKAEEEFERPQLAPTPEVEF